MNNEMMKLRLPVILTLILVLIACSMTASAHRMFVGQSMSVGLSAIYDDGEPAQNAHIKIFRDGEPYSENNTTSTGYFQMILPGKGTGDWKFIVSGEGHEEEVHFSIKQESQSAASAAAMALIAAPAVLLWLWRGRI